MSTLSKPAIAFAILLSCGLATGQCVAADAETLGQMFEIGWSTAYKARAATDDTFQTLQDAGQADAATRYAYALILIKQRRYTDANKLFSALLEIDDSNVYALRAKAWISALTKEYESALNEMDQLSRVLKGVESASVARFFGRMYGFLEGPCGAYTKSLPISEAKTQLVARLTESQQEVFAREHKFVLEEYSALTGEQADLEADTLRKGEEERTQLAQDLEQQKEKMVQRKIDLAPKEEKLRAELKSEMDVLIKEEQPLLRQLAQLEPQAIVLRREINIYTDRIALLRSRADRERDPLIREQYIIEGERLNDIARRYDAEMLALERRAANINAQRAQIRLKMQQTQSKYAEQLGDISEELAYIEKQTKRNELDQKKNDRRKVSGANRTSRALSAKAASLANYWPFPLETEKKRLLDAVR